MPSSHRYLILLYLRISVLMALGYVTIALMLPNVLSTANNNIWNNKAVKICANTTGTHIVEFYYTYSNANYASAQPYYDGYVTVAYLNYTYDFRKYSWYTSRDQLEYDLKECCNPNSCVDIYYNKDNPSDASSTLKNTYAFGLWLSGVIGGVLVVGGCLYASYRYDHRYYRELLFVDNFRHYKESSVSGFIV